MLPLKPALLLLLLAKLSVDSYSGNESRQGPLGRALLVEVDLDCSRYSLHPHVSNYGRELSVFLSRTARHLLEVSRYESRVLLAHLTVVLRFACDVKVVGVFVEALLLFGAVSWRVHGETVHVGDAENALVDAPV